MENVFVNTVIELHARKKWKEILKLNENLNDQSALKLLWVWPEERNLKFIGKIVTELEHKGITSIGCGCGLLEWITNQYTGLPVVGYEINKEWWESKYSNYKFIKLNYINDTNGYSLNSNYALLFCYFNNRKAFQDYVENYSGNLIIIIGPGTNTCRHTDPAPFNADFGNSKWHLYCYQEVKKSGDYIATFVRD